MQKIVFILLFLFCSSVFSQNEHKTIHQIDLENHKDNIFYKSNENNLEFMQDSTKPIVNSDVYGFYPYWVGAYEKYDWSALTTIVYFSYQVDSATGGYTTIRGFDETKIIEYAHQRGVKVQLCITSFGNSVNRAILNDTVKQNTLIHTAVDLVKKTGADGINLDFEAVPSEQRDNFTVFIKKMKQHLMAEIPNSELSICLFSVDWNDVFDIVEITPYLDKLLIMGYDYYYSGSENAGPTAPLEAKYYYLKRSVNYYLDEGVPKEKLILLLPWYARRWSVNSEEKQAQTTGKSKALSYASAIVSIENNEVEVDEQFACKWFNSKINSELMQTWFDDTETLETKYMYVKNMKLAGVGFWALGYQGTGNEMWETVKKVFSEDVSVDAPIKQSKTNLSPNPISRCENLQIKIDSSINEYIIKIYDIDGIIVGTYINQNSIPIRTIYTSGTYFLIIESANKIIAREKFIVK